MNLYAAIVSCKLRPPRKPATLHKFPVQDFRIPVAADSEQEAKIRLEGQFPWTFYKHIKITWQLIAENV